MMQDVFQLCFLFGETKRAVIFLGMPHPLPGTLKCHLDWCCHVTSILSCHIHLTSLLSLGASKPFVCFYASNLNVFWLVSQALVSIIMVQSWDSHSTNRLPGPFAVSPRKLKIWFGFADVNVWWLQSPPFWKELSRHRRGTKLVTPQSVQCGTWPSQTAFQYVSVSFRCWKWMNIRYHWVTISKTTGSVENRLFFSRSQSRHHRDGHGVHNLLAQWGQKIGCPMAQVSQHDIRFGYTVLFGVYIYVISGKKEHLKTSQNKTATNHPEFQTLSISQH